MNMKVVLGIIGVAIVIGGMVCFVNKSVNADKDNNADKTSKPVKNNEIIRAQSVNEATTELDMDKQDAAQKMAERHKEAKKEMQELVNTIFNDSKPEKTKNDETKKKILDDLDNL